MTTRPKIDNATARRIFLDRHALLDRPRRAVSRRDIATVVDRLGFVQIDSINTVERAHHVILHARAHGYRQEMLDRLMERDRGVFEHWTHDAAYIPITFFPHWRHRFERERRRIERADWWQDRIGADGGTVMRAVLDRIERDGAVMARDFEDGKGRQSGGWWDWSPSKAALDFLWRTGTLAVSGRVGFQKIYDLTERVIPQPHLKGAPERDETLEWAVQSAVERLGFGGAREIAGFWDLFTLPQVNEWFVATGAPGLIEVDVEGADGRLRAAWADPTAIETSAALPEPPSKPRILSPFDPMIRDRDRLLRLFGFDYRFEAFVPGPKRRFGYYIFPVLEGDRLIARIDMKANRDHDLLFVRAVWIEPGVRRSKSRIAGIEEAIERIGRFGGVSSVVYEDGWLKDAAERMNPSSSP